MAKAVKEKTSVQQAGGRDTRRRVFAAGESESEFDYKVLEVARVVRVVKGGRRFSFRASVITGDRRGRVGLGVGKSKDVQAAIQKAYDQGVKKLQMVQFEGRTIPHQSQAKHGGSQVMIRPAKPGTGLIAGGTVRLVAEMAGIGDLISKRRGSANKLNTTKAAIIAMSNLRLNNGKIS